MLGLQTLASIVTGTRYVDIEVGSCVEHIDGRFAYVYSAWVADPFDFTGSPALTHYVVDGSLSGSDYWRNDEIKAVLV